MEYIIGPIAVMAPIIVYLYFQLLKSKAQRKEIEKELEESKELRWKKDFLYPDQTKELRDLNELIKKSSNEDKSCPPAGGFFCPMMFYAIPTGQSAKCSSCGKVIRSSSPVF